MDLVLFNMEQAVVVYNILTPTRINALLKNINYN